MKKMSLLDKLIIHNLDFPRDQYISEVYPKKQIVLHHTASGRGVNGDFRHWINDSKRIATCVIIDSKGEVHQCFSSRYYAYHLGIGNSDFKRYALPYKDLNKSSIGVEIDAWGQLAKIEGKYYCWTGKEISKDRVTTYSKPFKTIPNTKFFEKMGVSGDPCYYYEKYTDAQIATLEVLLKYWKDIYGISLKYNSDMWGVTEKALRGDSGVFAHVSYRKYGKADAHPQPELITMLKSLEYESGEKGGD